MSNPNDEMNSMKGYPGATTNFTGALSGALAANTVHVAIATDGWYKISADVDIYWTGPGASGDITPGEACHEWANDTPQEVYCQAGQYLNILRVGSTAGVYFVNQKKGA
jgi:hypothetical protein